MLRTVADQPSLWDAILPEELRRLPQELARIDVLLHDPVFFAPFVPFFDPCLGRQGTRDLAATRPDQTESTDPQESEFFRSK